MTEPFIPTTHNCDQYLSEREGKYEYRAIRYRAAAQALFDMGLDDTMTVVDLGAGMTEFDYCLRREFNWRGRYIPVDGGIDGTDLRTWEPRAAHFFVALEILEHIEDWKTLLGKMLMTATKGIAISTPDPKACDVIAMDPTHVSAIEDWELEAYGVEIRPRRFYGGTYGETPEGTDSLFGVWSR